MHVVPEPDAFEPVVFGAEAGKIVVVGASAVVPGDGVVDFGGGRCPVAAGVSAGFVADADPVLEVFRWPVGGPADRECCSGVGVGEDAGEESVARGFDLDPAAALPNDGQARDAAEDHRV